MVTGPANSSVADRVADPLLTVPILPMLVRFALPNMGAMLATALAAIAAWKTSKPFARRGWTIVCAWIARIGPPSATSLPKMPSSKWRA